MVALPQTIDPEAYVAPLHPRVIEEYEAATYLYFDIETIPDQRPGTLEKLRSEVTAPAKYSKPDSIDLWLAENREKAALEALAKTSFDPAFGHVCTIGWATNDGDVHVEHAETVGEEVEILTAFFKSVPKRDATLVGHNIVSFDVPFLTKRAILLGVELPSDWAWPRDPKPWGKGLFDTMNAWAGSGRGDMISMNRLCGILGIVGKEDFDGSMVADAWAGGRHMTIAQYCDDDVRRTRAIHQKFLTVGY